MIGRVLNQVSGVSLELARITIAGTTLETYTDAGGKGRIHEIHAGSLTHERFDLRVNWNYKGSQERAPGGRVELPRIMKNSILLASYAGTSARLLAALITLAVPHGRAAPSKADVIVLLTHDQGCGDLSCHGKPVLKTPNVRIE